MLALAPYRVLLVHCVDKPKQRAQMVWRRLYGLGIPPYVAHFCGI